MSPNTSKNVPKIVEKYRRKYPELDSARLRPIIRNGNPELFEKNGNPNYEANKKMLTRCLRDAFKSQLSKESKNTKTREDKQKLGFSERRRLGQVEKNRPKIEPIDEEILRRRRRMAARNEINCLPSNIKGLARIEKENEIKRKYGLL